jgi:hypothetical protein
MVTILINIFFLSGIGLQDSLKFQIFSINGPVAGTTSLAAANVLNG